MADMLTLADSILARVADRGDWHAQIDELDGVDVPALRSQLRRAGRARGLHIRTYLVNGTLIVAWPEWEPTPIQRAATAIMMRTLFTDHAVTYDEALELARRRQIRTA